MGEGTPGPRQIRVLMGGLGRMGDTLSPLYPSPHSPHPAPLPRSHLCLWHEPLTCPTPSARQEPHVVLEVGYSGLRKTALPMKPRVSVQDSALRNGNFSLRINPVRSEDAGLYEAQVTYDTEVRSCQVELGVITGRRRWKPWRTLIVGLGRL